MMGERGREGRHTEDTSTLRNDISIRRCVGGFCYHMLQFIRSLASFVFTFQNVNAETHDVCGGGWGCARASAKSKDLRVATNNACCKIHTLTEQFECTIHVHVACFLRK